MQNRRPTPSQERPAPAPASSDRGASSPAPQQDHTMMRQTQVDRSSESHPSQPTRMAEPQRAPESARAPQAESHQAPSKDSGSNGNRGGSQYQDRGRGRSQEADPK
jgi:hypothetical protein